VNKVNGLWEDVQVGFFVQDKNGKWWKVEALSGQVWMVDKDGKKASVNTPVGHAPVTYMYDPKNLIERTLDGKEIS